MSKRVLITGVTGQDGSYLAELLVSRGDQVWGTTRDPSTIPGFLEHLLEPRPARLHLRPADLRDAESLLDVVSECEPDEIYNLAAQSHVGQSFQRPAETGDVTGLGAVRLLETVRRVRPEARVFQASSAEMFGLAEGSACDEQTPFHPASPYAAAKVFAHHMAQIYRQSSGLFVACGILFNHESPRRGEGFVTRKITRAAADIVAGRQQTVSLGNLDAARDWGFAGDYVEAMRRMLAQDAPDDYVIATGQTHTVREFCSLAFDHAGLPLRWEGSELNEVGIDRQGAVRVQVDPQLFRPADPHALCGNSRKAAERLGWKNRHSFPDLVRMMTEADIRAGALTSFTPER